MPIDTHFSRAISAAALAAQSPCAASKKLASDPKSSPANNVVWGIGMLLMLRFEKRFQFVL
jgi:hypothetical protein